MHTSSNSSNTVSNYVAAPLADVSEQREWTLLPRARPVAGPLPSEEGTIEKV